MTQSSPLSIIAITTAVAGQEARLRAAQEKLVADTLNEPGCLRYELTQSLDDRRILIFTEQWASESDWRGHMQGSAMQRFSASGAPQLISDFQLYRTAAADTAPDTTPKNSIGSKLRNTLALGTLLLGLTMGGWHLRAAEVAAPDSVPALINAAQLKWEKTIPALGDKSPEYAILHSDPETHLTMLMFRTPIAVHIKAHTHERAETHVVLEGGSHVFEANGKRYVLEKGGYLRMPGGTVHEAWLPAGSQTLNIEESGWVVNWLHGGPSVEDAEQVPPQIN